MKYTKTVTIHSEKKGKLIFAGIALILLGVLILLDAFYVVPLDIIGLTPWRIALILATVIAFGSNIRKPELIPIWLGLLFIACEPTVAYLIGSQEKNLLNNWLVMGVAALLTTGFSLIFRHGMAHITIDGNKGTKSSKFGSHTFYIDAKELTSVSYGDILGNLDIYFINKDAYAGNGTVSVSDICGNITVHVPTAWFVQIDCTDHLGSLVCPNQDGSYDKALTVSVSDICGNVTILKE